MNNCSTYESIKEKRKEEINLSKSSLQDSKLDKEEHLFSMQLISQEKNLATKINHFEGSGPEWLVPRGTPFFTFGRGQDFWKGEREITYWCMPAKLTLSVFFFLSLFSVFPLIFLFFFFFFLVIPRFYFVIFRFSILSSSLSSLLLLYIARASFYSACRNWILLF